MLPTAGGSREAEIPLDPLPWMTYPVSHSPMKKSHFGLLAMTLVCLSAASPAWAGSACCGSDAQAAPTSQTSWKDVSREIENFAQVTPRLYRGAQPSQKGFVLLKDAGVDTVVNFRYEKDLIEKERKWVEELGMKFVSLPWHGDRLPPAEVQETFLNLVKSNSDSTVFVHCKRGAERTGTMIACYRILEEGWTPEAAYKEMKERRFRPALYSHLKRYVLGLKNAEKQTAER